MKLRSQNGTGVETNAESKSVDFAIGDASVVIEILRNRLYSNPIQTLVQEYLCNGRDACRDAKRDSTPLEVTIPNISEPVFKVRDFGTGISPENMKKIFVLYGASTKRNSDTQTGGFGIGAKSAWAYTDNFTIITYLDGKARHYIAHIGKNNNGSLDLISETKTTKENGTEIQIGVKHKDFEAFTKAIYRATLFWKVKPTFIGIVPSQIPVWYSNTRNSYETKSVGIFSSDKCDRMFRPKSWTSDTGLVFVVDGVPYQLDHSLTRLPYAQKLASLYKDGYVCAIHVGNGDVEVSASREKIADSEYSKAGVDNICARAIKEIETEKSKEFGEASQFKNFMSVVEKHYRIFKVEGHQTFKTKNNSYKISYLLGVLEGAIEAAEVKQAHLKNNGKHFVFNEPLSFQVIETAFVYEDEKEGKNTTRAKLKTFLQRNPDRKRILFFSNQNLKDKKYLELVSDLQAIPLSSLDYTKSEKKTTKKGQGKDLNKISVSVLSVLYPHSYAARLLRSTQILDVSTISSKQKYVYVQHTKDGIQFDKGEYQLREITQYLNTNGYKFCSIAPSFIARIKDSKNFITLEDFTKNTDSTLIEKSMKSIRVAIVGKPRLDRLFPFTSYIKDGDFADPVLSTGMKIIKSIDSDLRLMKRDELETIPEGLLAAFLEANAELREEKNKIEQFFTHLTTKYPLYDRIGFSISDEEIVKEFVSYTNNKFKA